jgi:HK97 family phage portal protein
MLKKSYITTQLMPAARMGRPVSTTWDYENAIRQGYNRSATVYSCVNLIAKSAASVQWKTYKRGRGGVWNELPDHPLTLLIEQPNPYMSQKDFIERMTHALYLGGNSIFTKVRGTGGAVVELWYLPQQNIKPVPDQKKFISHYLYDAEGVKREIKTQDILHQQFLNPLDLFWGIAPIRAAAEVIDTDSEAISWNRYSMQQRAISDGAFILDQHLNMDQWNEAREQIKAQHTGSENARNFWVLGAGAQWQPMSMSPAEMDFIESRKLNREEICSIFGVPPVMIGHYENATLANIETGRKIFWLDTIIPYLVDIRNSLNAALAREYGLDIRLDFDTSTVEAIQANLQEKIQNAQSLFNMGVPFNEINKQLDLGFDEIEGGDTGFLPSNLLPLEIAANPPAAQPADPAADPNNADPNQPTDPNAPLDDPNKPKNEPEPKKSAGHAGSHKNVTQAQIDAELQRRAFHWKAIEQKRLPYDMAMTRKAAQIFDQMGETVANAYAAGRDPAKTIEGFTADWIKLFEKTYRNIFEDVGAAELEDILDRAGYKKGYEPDEIKGRIKDIVDQGVLKWITETAASKVTGVLEFTKQSIAAEILDLEKLYQQEGLSVHIDRVAKAIKQKFKDFSRYRSYMIARTEVAGASNAANSKAQQVAQQKIDPTAKRIILKRQWISSRDERVRDSHTHMDGQTVGLQDPFYIYTPDGSKTDRTLQYPADYAADEPAETINCRCTTKTLIEKA